MCPTSSPIQHQQEWTDESPARQPHSHLARPRRLSRTRELKRVGPLTSPPHTLQEWSLICMRWLRGPKSGYDKITVLAPHRTNLES